MANAEGDDDVEDGEPQDNDNEPREMNDWGCWERAYWPSKIWDKNKCIKDDMQPARSSCIDNWLIILKMILLSGLSSV
jgi:hypothetical protein